MKAGIAVLLTVVASTAGDAQQPAPTSPTGNPLGLPIAPAADGKFNPISSNVKVYGSVYSAESCTYDPERGVIVIPNRGVPQNIEVNNAWITLLNHDGSVHTSRWVGLQTPGAQRDGMNPPLRLNEPYGSDLVNGVLYLADRDGGTSATDPIISVIRRFNMKTGAQMPDIRAGEASWLNDIAVAADGTIYGTVTGAGQVWKVTPDGKASIFLQGELINRPNGVAIDPQGQIVVLTMGNDAVLTYSREGTLVKTEHAVQAGNDGIVIMPDGTKYVSSVVNGGVSRIRPNQPAELIAENIPSAASMCYDSGAKQLAIPMNANNAIALIKLP